MAYEDVAGKDNNTIKGADLYNNTIANSLLMPTTDSLVSDYPLENFDPVKELKKESTGSGTIRYDLYVKMTSSVSIKLENVQSISGLGMERVNNQRPDSEQKTVVNLPDAANYTNLKVKFVYTANSFFLTWLVNGATKGAAYRADLEIYGISPATGEQIYTITLHDAFPVNWSLSSLNSSESKSIVFEEVTFTYSYVNISAAK